MMMMMMMIMVVVMMISAHAFAVMSSPRPVSPAPPQHRLRTGSKGTMGRRLQPQVPPQIPPERTEGAID